ncbi:MAG: hypothetical protein EOM24_28075 [Chloroflexia bacterium]|nr:hypothetical protein [Chloroflexia bacterium]
MNGCIASDVRAGSLKYCLTSRTTEVQVGSLFHSLLSAVVTEAVRIAEAQGITLPYADPVAHVLQVARATAANRSSMLQDRLRGAPTEIATINGAIVASGARLGIPTPYNATLLALITALETTQREDD